MPKTRLHENIRTCRKAMHFTQEQLAEATGVTVGAVSKWESGLSNPDLSLLPVLAQIFNCSIDVLLGYEMPLQTADDAAEEIRALRLDRRYEEGLTAAENALRRFPNHFQVVYESAAVYDVKGSMQRNPENRRRAQVLLTRAYGLLSQNTDPTISELSIMNSIAALYIPDEIDQALELLKKYNYDGINNGIIGSLLAYGHHTEEARGFLSDSFLQAITEIFSTGLGLSACYRDTGDTGEAMAVLQWLRTVLAPLLDPQQCTYLNKLEVILLTISAQVAAAGEDEKEAEHLLREALQKAQRFDAAPDYDATKIRFFCGKNRSLGDDFGATAAEGISRQLTEDVQTAPMTMNLWRKINEEQS